MEFPELASIGLTTGEQKVYLALLRLGQSKTGILATTAGVSSSKVYKILARLEKKGLVGHVIQQKTKHYTAVAPERILDYVAEQEQQFQKSKEQFKAILPALQQQKELFASNEEATVYDGLKAVQNLYRSLLTELRKGEQYYVIGAGYGPQEQPGVKSFFQNFHAQRAKQGIRVRMLANHNVKGLLVPATQMCSEVRYLPEYLITNMSIVFCKKKSFIILWLAQPKAFLIHSEEAVKSFQSYFDAFWGMAKK